MTAAEWIKQAEAAGWRVESIKAGAIRLACGKLGCTGTASASLDRLGDVPEPCTAPHRGGYGQKVYQDYAEIVTKLRQRRMAVGMSQEELTDATGLADGHINKLEAYHRTAQLPTLQLWARALGYEIALAPCDLPPKSRAIITGRRKPLQTQNTTRGLFDDR